MRACVLDLAVYELGNVLTRSLRWTADRVVDQVEDLLAIVSPRRPRTQPAASRRRRSPPSTG